MKSTVWNELTSTIARVFEDVNNYGEEQIQVNCPKCQERDDLAEPDGKFNLEINLKKRKFRCWKCESPYFSGDLKRLIEKYGSYSDISEYNEYVEHNFDIFEDEEEEKEEEKVIELPKEFIAFKDMDFKNKDHMDAYNYLIFDRKLEREIILKFQLGFCIEGRYKKRIIVPSINKNGMINYFAARTYVGAKPPYDNVKSSKDVIIFNEGFIDWDSTVYLVEGPFDFLSFNFNTIPLLGKVIGEKLFLTLNLYKPNIVVILDPDAWSNAVRLYQQLRNIYVDCEEKVKILELDVIAKDEKGNILYDKYKNPIKYDLDELKRNKGMGAVIEELKKARQLVDDDFLYV